MNKDTFKLDKTLSIVELENRQELTVALAAVEASKGNDSGRGDGLDVVNPNCMGRCT